MDSSAGLRLQYVVTMDAIWNVNLIHLFNFYLGLTFFLSTYLRWNQYHSVLSLVRAVPGRWPRLLQLVKQHGNVFLTWSTILPAALAFLLFAINLIASRWLWPHVALTPAGVLQHPLALPAILCLGLIMLCVDGYATFTVGRIDSALMEEYFDQAEYWLRPWTAPVVRVFTFGYINPRKMVTGEVRKALLETSRLMNSTLWWVIAQIGFRVAFGLSLWITYGVQEIS